VTSHQGPLSHNGRSNTFMFTNSQCLWQGLSY